MLVKTIFVVLYVQINELIVALQNLLTQLLLSITAVETESNNFPTIMREEIEEILRSQEICKHVSGKSRIGGGMY